MPIYSKVYTIPKNSEKKFKLQIEGDYITKVRIRFPPGPQGLLKVAVFYGLEPLFPCETDTYFVGEDEVIEWEEYWQLPETPCELTILAENQDDTYDHSVYIVIVTRWAKQTLDYRIADRVAGFLRYIFGRR